MGWNNYDYGRNDRDAEDYKRQRKEIESINNTVQKLKNDNDRLRDVVLQNNNTTERFHQEIRRRDLEMTSEREKYEALIQKNLDEIEQVKNDMRETRKRADEEAKKRSNDLKKRKAQLESENKEFLIKKEQHNFAKQNKQNTHKLKESVQRYKKQIYKLLNDDDKIGINNFLRDIEEEVMLYQSVLMESLEIDQGIINDFYDTVCYGYEEIADFFYTTNEYERAIELYEKLSNFAVKTKTNPMVYFKFGRACMMVGQYTKAIELLSEVENSQSFKSSKNSDIVSEINLMCFHANMKIENDIEAQKYLNTLIIDLRSDSTIVFKFMGIFYEYLCYKPSEEKFKTYFSFFTAFLRDNKDLGKKIDNEIFSDYEWKDFYKAIYEYRGKNYKEALRLLCKYNDNKLANLYYMKIMSEIEEYDDIAIEDVTILISNLEEMLAGKETEKRKSFLEESNNLLLLRVETSVDFAKFYQNLFSIKLNLELKRSMLNELLTESALFLESLKKYNIVATYQTKITLAKLYNFYKQQNDIEKAMIFYEYLKQTSTSMDLEQLISLQFSFDNTIDDYYEISNHKLPYINNTNYYSLKCKNKTNSQVCCILETYRENISVLNREKRLQALQKEQLLGTKYSCFTQICSFEILEDITRVVYPEFKDNFANYLKESFSYSEDNKVEIITFANQLIQIFEKLDTEGIILSSFIPDKIMISIDGNLVLRDTFFDQTFRSESQSTVNSARTSKSNRYKSPDEQINRTSKTNCYLLGILLYELVYGSYLFEGIQEYSLITRLHKGEAVDKSLVYPLKNRLIMLDARSVNVTVEKVKIDETSEIPKIIQESIKKILDTNPKNRPSIEQIKDIFSSISLDEDTNFTKKDVHIPKLSKITEKEFKELISSVNINKIVVKNKNVLNRHFSDFTNYIIEDSSTFDYQIFTDNSTINVSSFGKKYKVEITNNMKLNAISENKQCQPISKQVIDLNNLIKLLTDKIVIENNESYIDFLYQTREIIYVLEDDLNTVIEYDSDYLDLASKNSVNIDKSFSNDEFIESINHLMNKE